MSNQAGITRATHDVLSFGGGFFDYDNDGWLDLFIANGHVYPEVEQASPGTHYKQLNSLFHNEHNGKFVDVGNSAGNGFDIPHVGRGSRLRTLTMMDSSMCWSLTTEMRLCYCTTAAATGITF